MLKIAICDDRKEDRDRMHQYVLQFCQERMLQAEIKVFEHPDALICACEDFRPHIYILDIVMPMVNGIQAAMKLINLEEERSVTIKVKGGYCTLHLDDIMYIDYRNHVVSYHLLSGETISTSTLRIGFAEYLNQHHFEEDFVLCHESVAVGIKAIDKLTKTDVMVRNREILPVAKSRYAQVAEKYMNYRFR